MMENIEIDYFALNRLAEEYADEEAESTHIKDGDVVLLNKNSLKSSVAKYLAGTGHMFLVLNVKNDIITVATITSQLETLGKYHHYTFKDLGAVPFNKPCGVNLQSIGGVSAQSIRRVVGSISKEDLNNVFIENMKDRKITQRLEHLLRMGSMR